MFRWKGPDGATEGDGVQSHVQSHENTVQCMILMTQSIHFLTCLLFRRKGPGGAAEGDGEGHVEDDE